MNKKIPFGRVFYMMRHAETEDNKSQLVSGKGRVAMLTENGRKQAIDQQILLSMLDPSIDYIVTSEMQRTRDTAEILCKANGLCDVKRYVESGINERAYGAAEGLSDAERERLKQAYGSIEGEESKESLKARTLKAIVDSLLRHKGTPLFVTHGGNIRRILEETVGKKVAESERIANCALYEFISPQNDAGNWRVNSLTVENNEIKRKNWIN